MGTEDDNDVVWHLVQLFDEDRPTRTQVFDHELVVHHFMPHIDRRPENFQGPVDDFDGAIHTRAEAARVGEFDLHGKSRHAKRSEEHTSELQSLMRISYAVFCLKTKTTTTEINIKRTIINH